MRKISYFVFRLSINLFALIFGQFLLATVVLANTVSAVPLTVQTTLTGTVFVCENGLKVAEIQPMIYTNGWQSNSFHCSDKGFQFNPVNFLADGEVDLKTTSEIRSDGLHIHYVMTPRKTVNVLNVRAELSFPYNNWIGKPYQLGDAQGAIPVKPAKNFVISQSISKPLVLGPTIANGGLSVTLTALGLQTTLQDSRKWSANLLAYFTHQEPADKPWKWNAGEEKDFDFILSSNRSLTSFPGDRKSLSEGFEGTWKGYFTSDFEKNLKAHLIISIEKNTDGSYGLSYTNVETGEYDKPAQKVTEKGSSLHVQFSDGTIDLKLSQDGTLLSGTDRWGTWSDQFELTRGLDFSIPRMDDHGDPVTTYSYQPPQASADGWEVGDLRDGHADLNLLEKGFDLVLNGTIPNLHSIVIVQHGKLVLDEYFYGYNADTPHKLCSAEKSIISLLFGIAQDRGLVNTDQKLYDFFPEYREKTDWDTRKDKITLDMVLSMTSGFSCNDFTPANAPCLDEFRNSSDGLDYALDGSLSHEPGESFNYCSACLAPLLVIFQKQSGLPLKDFYQKYLYDPLGITPEWMWGHFGALEGWNWIKPRDMAKLGSLVLNHGKWNGQQIVSQKWMDESTQLKVPGEKALGDWGYGYLWWEGYVFLHGQKVPATIALGDGGQIIFAVPQLDLVCVLTAGNYGVSDWLYFTSVVFFEKYVLNALY